MSQSLQERISELYRRVDQTYPGVVSHGTFMIPVEEFHNGLDSGYIIPNPRVPTRFQTRHGWPVKVDYDVYQLGGKLTWRLEVSE